MPKCAGGFVVALFTLAIAARPAAGSDIELKRPMAVINAKVVASPGRVIEKCVILIEKGRIRAVGTNVEIPAQAERFDASGMVVYPGFIDALTHRGISRDEPDAADRERAADVVPDVREGVQSATVEGYRRLVHPSWKAAELFDPANAKREEFRKSGFTAALVAPRTVIFSGESAVVTLSDDPARRSIIRAGVAQHAAFVTGTGGGRRGRFGEDGGYPVSLMGAIAVFRQMLMDAAWHRDLLAWEKRLEAKTKDPALARDKLGYAVAFANDTRIAIDRELEALWPLLDGRTPAAMLANTEVEIHRALDIAAEFKLTPIIVGGKEAWKAAERLKTEKVPVILSLKWSDEPKKPQKKVESLATVMVDEAEAVARGIDRSPVFDQAWEEQAWEPKRAFEERERLYHEEIDNAKALHEAGVPFAIGSYELKSPDEVMGQLRKMIERGLGEEAAVAALTSQAAEILGISEDAGEIAANKLANLTLLSAPLTDKECAVKWVFVDGRPFDVQQRDEKKEWKKNGGKPPSVGGEKDPSSGQPPVTTTAPATTAPAETTTAPAVEEPGTISAPTTSSAPSYQPDDEDLWPEFASEIEADRKPRFQTGGDVLIQNATLLTITGGDLAEADLLIENGKIIAVGGKIPAPPGVKSIDLRGYFVSPGIFDPHSHMCVSGSVNEGTLSVTPEVRIADAVNPKDIGAFRALAGGVTMIHTMHGSANTIGGQCTVVRLKYGRPVSEWRVPEAPRTVKFALGENVKQSNSQTRATRFPNSRMGVEAVFHRSFDAAVKYRQELDAFDKSKAAGEDPRPVRRDLRLEALDEIRAGRIWVNCHCYRADEILRLFSVAERFGFRIAVLQHVLEGYRVIPEMLRHGAAASTFSDWWAYKLESFDAIPHNAARMAQAGVVTTVNSDSAELVRHLNLEAAKSMRFGGLSPNDSLRLVTLNSAIQFGVDKHFGSIEVGKRGDLAVFDGHPLDTFSKCVLTMIDGEVYFQHDAFSPEMPATPLAGRTFQPPREPMEVVPSATGEYWIRGGVIHPVSGPALEEGVLVIRDGRIAAVGASDAGTPSRDAVSIDATGLHVYPGLICAGVTLGLLEIDSVQGSVDARDIARFQPDLAAVSGYNPFSTAIGVARSEGVTCAMIESGGGIVQGQTGLVHLDGWSMPEALHVSPAGLMVQLPSMTVNFPWWMDEEAKEQAKKEFPKNLADVEDFFRTAAQYARMKKLGVSDPSAGPDHERRLEAMAPYMNRELPVLFRADSYKAIREALRFSEKYELRPIIYGGREAWKVADELADKKVDVILVRSMSLPGGDYEPWDSVYACAAVLDRHGVQFCFTVAEPSLTKHVGIEAGMAVAHGLSPARAIEAITLDAAKILGVGDRLGSLEAGKIADIIVTTDSPLQASNCVVAEFIRGVPVDLSNKHTRDDAKFRSRPRPVLPPAVDNLRGPPAMRMKPA